RQRIRSVAQRRPDHDPSGKLRDANREELVEPEETMGSDLYAGDEVENGQQCCRENRPLFGGFREAFQVRFLGILQGCPRCSLGRKHCTAVDPWAETTRTVTKYRSMKLR